MPSSDRSSRGKPSRTETGRKYEKLAIAYFEDQGFNILQRNWRTGSREIDIILRKENLIVFVEVKSVGSLKYGHPAERVDKHKIAHLTSAAQQYLADNNVSNTDLRFDVVTFVNGQLEHFPNAFPAEG